MNNTQYFYHAAHPDAARYHERICAAAVLTMHPGTVLLLLFVTAAPHL
jgi:hypothetical protein